MSAQTIFTWAERKPEATALVYNGESLSYGQFANCLAAAINFLRSYSLPAGSTAVVVIGNLRSAWLAVLALRAVGLHTITVQNIEEAQKLGVTNVSTVVFGEGTAQPRTGQAFASATWITFPTKTILANSETSLNVDGAFAPEPGGHFIYTSGTTGTHKRIFTAGGDGPLALGALPLANRMTERTIFHGLFFPLFTGAGASLPGYAWRAGGTVVLDQRPGALGTLLQQQFNMIFLVPAMIETMAASNAGPVNGFADLHIALGGGFAPYSALEKIRRFVTSDIEIHYASSECGTVARSKFGGDPEDVVWLTPEPDRFIKIENETGEPCGLDEEGELTVELTETDRRAYVDDPETSARIFRNGFFYPGDMAMRRADGKIRILGRTQDVVNVAGFKVATAPLEQQIGQYLGARTVCILDSQNAAGETEIVVAVEADREPTPEQVARVKEHFKMARTRIAVMSQFPRGEAMQKVDRRALRNVVWPNPAT